MAFFRQPDPRREIPKCLAALLLLSSISSPVQAQAKEQGKAQAKPDLRWESAATLGLEGRGWNDVNKPFDRLPKKAEKVLRPAVWKLSRHSAGLAVRFTSDANSIHARWSLSSARLAMPHMAATGVSGLDLYVKSEGVWRYCATAKPSGKTNRARLVHNIGAELRDYLLYLPLYNGVESLELGVASSSILRAAAPRDKAKQKPIVFYGTSITQGGCASRPGMVHTAILGRVLDRPVINLGFSGNGRLEIELAELLSELDAAVFIIDCGPNLNAAQITARLQPFVTHLRSKRPDTPILLVEDPTYSNAHLIPKTRARIDANRKAMRAGFDILVTEGLTKLHYLAGEGLFPSDSSGTVDGTHPTDAGFAHQAKAFEPGLRAILAQKR